IFPRLSKTLFYEYQTLEEVAEHLLSGYVDDCFSWTGTAGGRSERGQPHRKDPLLTAAPEHVQSAEDTVAIIGVSARFPGAATADAFWENLKAGRVSIDEVPAERWSQVGFYYPQVGEAIARGGSYSRWGAFLEGFADFDPLFFGLSPSDARGMDPQERLFLEVCWQALEDAGCAPSRLTVAQRSRTGVFGGITRQGFNLHSQAGTACFSTSFSSCVNRVSHLMDFHGPSVAVDAMCASSLVAVHEGCDYIRSGRGEMALAGGVNLYLHPYTWRVLSHNRLMATGRDAQVFGRGGTGFVPGEGAGAVLLKGYAQARRDGDAIYGLIRGSAVTHSGRTNGYMTPSPVWQAEAIRRALSSGGVDAGSISYVEASANGSEMADAIELAALSQVFGGREGSREGYRLGSVKPNVGHGESVSGMAQLVKVLWSLRHGMRAPTRIPDELNPNVDFTGLPFVLQDELAAWDVPAGAVRRALITGSGAGGVNVSVVVEEAPAAAVAVSAGEEVVFVLSARSEERLRVSAGVWRRRLEEDEGLSLREVAWTLQSGREEMGVRLSAVSASAKTLSEWLREVEEGGMPAGVNWHDTRVEKRVDREAVRRAQAAGDRKALARLWVEGNGVAWESQYGERRVRKVSGLPGYPFRYQRLWVEEGASEGELGTTEGIETNKAVEFYTAGAQPAQGEFKEEYLTFCPFERREPGFSMTRVFLYPQENQQAFALMQDKQREMRQVLFSKEDFRRVGAVLDIGCGHGTDVIQLSALYPHLKAQGFTITGAQAVLGNQRIKQLGLERQA
ncbi:MAG: beta-ketoacyl synthase N-terminal-like domain-containing protein, partial [Enterobacter roggenkampii]